MEKDELQEYLDALDRDDCYRVDQVLKDSQNGRTEQVYFVGTNGSEMGPFVRKFLKRGSGQGVIYERIFDAQQAGRRFAHLPHIHECYLSDSSFVVVVEFIPGKTLQEYVEENGPSIEVAERFFPELCDAVSELHESFDPPIIHRDLTPANIIVSEGSVALIDLGIARTFSPGATRDTTFLGTREFAPPEQYGFRQTDIRSDVFAVGKVLDYCLGGIFVNPESAQRSDVDDGQLRWVIESATEFDPEMRFQTIREMKEAFQRAFIDESEDDERRSSFAHQEGVEEEQRDRTMRKRESASSHEFDSVDQPIESVSSTASPSGNGSSEASTLLEKPVLEPPNESQLVFIEKDSMIQERDQENSADVLLGREAYRERPLHTNNGSTAGFSGKMSPSAGPIAFVKKAFRRVPKALGISWDVLIAFFWILVIAVSFPLIGQPEGEFATYPLWFRVVEVYGIVILPFTVTLYYLLDLRFIREMFPNLKLISRRKTWYFLPTAIIAMWILVVLIGMAAGLLQFTS